MRLFGLTISRNKTQGSGEAVTVSSIEQLTTSLFDGENGILKRIAVLEQTWTELSKAIEATRRKVYRDAANEMDSAQSNSMPTKAPERAVTIYPGMPVGSDGQGGI